MTENIILVGQEYCETLCSLARKVFLESFLEYHTLENINKYMNCNYNVTAQKKELCDPLYKTFIAFNENTPIAFAQIKQNTNIFMEDDDSIELKRLYVDKKYIGKGIGKKMLNRCLEEIRKMCKKTVWLYVLKQNNDAIKFYKKYEFNIIGDHTFKVGDKDEYFYIMAKSLNH